MEIQHNLLFSNSVASTGRAMFLHLSLIKNPSTYPSFLMYIVFPITTIAFHTLFFRRHK